MIIFSSTSRQGHMKLSSRVNVKSNVNICWTSQWKSSQRMTSFAFNPWACGVLISYFIEEILPYIRPNLNIGISSTCIQIWSLLVCSIRLKQKFLHFHRIDNPDLQYRLVEEPNQSFLLQLLGTAYSEYFDITAHLLTLTDELHLFENIYMYRYISSI